MGNLCCDWSTQDKQIEENQEVNPILGLQTKQNEKESKVLIKEFFLTLHSKELAKKNQLQRKKYIFHLFRVRPEIVLDLTFQHVLKELDDYQYHEVIKDNIKVKKKPEVDLGNGSFYDGE